MSSRASAPSGGSQPSPEGSRSIPTRSPSRSKPHRERPYAYAAVRCWQRDGYQCAFALTRWGKPYTSYRITPRTGQRQHAAVGITEEIKRELCAEAEVPISRASGLFLVLLRSALPDLDAKRASKWAAALAFADHHEVRSQRLVALLRNHGGIEGAARMAAKLRASRDV